MNLKHTSYGAAAWLATALLVVSCGSDDSSSTDGPDASVGGSGGSGGSGTGGTGGGTTGGTGATAGDAGQAGTGGTGITGGSGGVAGQGGIPDAGPDGEPTDATTDGTMTCSPLGAACTDGAECCSAFCDPSTSTCSADPMVCTGTGGPCVSNTECCSLNCAGGFCGQDLCISDGDACTVGGDACCSGMCNGGVCDDINGTVSSCMSAGNTCGDDADCCSKLCTDGTCELYVSHCVQLYDLCSHDNQCCGGVCEKASDADPYGYCSMLSVGPNRCADGAAGMVCDDCGMCCARACAPGPKGVMICQAASGCRPQGEICKTSLDCCGGDGQTGLPGSTSADVTCEKAADTDEYGRCKVQGCLPQGEVCQLIGGACSESTALPSNCCPTNANPSDPNHKKGECEFDTLLIPRCNGLKECVPSGGYCSSAADCCDDLPCVPDPNDNNRLKCFIPDDGGTTCIPEGGMCTSDGDCCPGSTCIIPPGEIFGICGTQGTGGSGGGPADSGTGGSGGSPECSAYGQSCTIDADCCFTDQGVTCIGGKCLIQG